MSYSTLDPKDPNGADRFGWDLTSICIASGTTLVGATVTEVDSSDQPVAVPTVSITQVSFTSSGMVTALVSGGTPGTSVLLRCRYTLANGEGSDRTIKVRISHL